MMSRVIVPLFLACLLAALPPATFAAPWLKSPPSPTHAPLPQDLVVSVAPTAHPSPSQDHIRIEHNNNDSENTADDTTSEYAYQYTEHEDMDSETGTQHQHHYHHHHYHHDEKPHGVAVVDHDEPTVLDTAQTYADILADDAVHVFNTVVNETSHFFTETVPEVVTGVIPEWFGNVTDAAATTVEGVANSTRDVIEHDIPETAGYVASNASEFMRGFSNAVSTTVDALTPNISLPSAHDVYSNVTTYAEETYHDISSSAQETYNDATEYASAVYENVTSQLPSVHDVYTNVTAVASDAYHNLTEALPSLPSTDDVISNISAIASDAENAAMHAASNLTEWGEHVYDNVTEQLPSWHNVKHNITDGLPAAAGQIVSNVTDRLNVSIPEVFVSPSPSPTYESLLERTLEYLFNTSLHDNMTLGTCGHNFCPDTNVSLVTSCMPVLERKREGVWCNLKNATTNRSQPVCCGSHDCCRPHVINISMLSLCGGLVLAFMVYICTLMTRNKEERDAVRHRRLQEDTPTIVTTTNTRTL